MLMLLKFNSVNRLLYHIQESLIILEKSLENHIFTNAV